MKKSSIRSFGIGLFIAGSVFQLQHLSEDKKITSTHAIDEQAYEKSQNELNTVKQQLAQLQLDLENAKKEQTSVEIVENTEKKEKKEEQAITITKTLLIVKAGMNSRQICTSLERSGIIQNKKDFEKYLIAQKLTGRIQVGKYELDSSMTFEQIAEKLTTK